MKLKEIDLKKLKKDAQFLNIDKDASYIQAYREFLQYFKKLDVIEKHQFFIGAHFVYGWMPRMLNLNIQELEEVLMLLNKAKESETLLSGQELEVLKNCINHSMVGTSKLLHFINPKKYAIWDSRVLNYLNRLGYGWSIGNTENYLSYLDIVRDIVNNAGYEELHTLVENMCGYKIEPTRVIEMIMYETDRNGYVLEER
ncbi:MAG: hypothetical protein COW88_02880 [Candidatus Lloydbacteria bacterium CG22_combo_CG10-13_8_21_14_all_47_15]|uniref:Uncharacterized protein n=1 Tax=Candidatus Lloydbacteria bacterium CG22_combo_CG10-13_8_21_14_all_47_15 TaxID=1974635 RepID=A0A2H0CUR4_9BACT|nr:MAG: hypothetical protein COW88_02880 [Candidatus Lloydbacteria bacterium CG22_combo_CG10-13_8_21_14_all_47_15]